MKKRAKYSFLAIRPSGDFCSATMKAVGVNSKYHHCLTNIANITSYMLFCSAAAVTFLSIPGTTTG